MKKDETISAAAKAVFAENFQRLLQNAGKSQSDIVTDLGITASTVSDWCLGKKYPRVDRMQLLADYFGVMKSDLTEKKETHPLFSEHVLRMAEINNDFKEAVELLSRADPSLYDSIKQIAKGIIIARRED